MRVHLKQQINASPEAVFSVSADIERWPEVINGVERTEVLTEGPVGAGTKFHETRVMMKKEVTEVMAITSFDPPREYVVESDSCGSHFRTVMRFHPVGSETCMELEMVSKPTTVMARLLSPMMLLMKGTIQKLIARDMRDLAAALEQAD